jgi:transposase InsO family protein
MVPQLGRATIAAILPGWRSAEDRLRGTRDPNVKPTALHFLLLTVSGWVNRRQLAAIEYLRAENRVLREQLGPKRRTFTDAQRRLLAERAKALGRAGLAAVASIATPDTILRWYRSLIAAKYDGAKVRGPGRPARHADLRDVVLRMARENPRWGYTRIVGAMKNLGHDLARNTVKRILLADGIAPAPLRGKQMSWRTFLRAHWGAIAAADFFSVETLTLRGLSRYFVFFFIDLETRRVHVGGIVHQLHGAWTTQIARNAVDAVDGCLRGKTHLILDRDPVYTHAFRRLLRDAGVRPLVLPADSPNLNAYAERFVRSIRDDCLNHLVLLGENHLRTVVAEYVEHYHTERNHQGIGNELIESRVPANTDGVVRRRKRLGGLLSYYYDRAAA